MDGAPPFSSGIAQDKAWTVSAFNGIATHEFFGSDRGRAPLREGTSHRTGSSSAAGSWVRVDGALVGAVGVSGGTAAQDREIAEAGAAALRLGLGGRHFPHLDSFTTSIQARTTR